MRKTKSGKPAYRTGRQKALTTIVGSLFIFYVLSAVPVLAQEATPSGISDEIRERVREKIEGLTKKPKALVGTITEITDSTIQIRAREDKLEMAATDENTTYARFSRGRRSVVDFEDLVLGEFIIAMGFKDGNDVLQATRVVTYEAAPIPKKEAVFGQVGVINGRVLTVKTSSGESWSVETSSQTDITTKGEEGLEEVVFSDISVGDTIVAAGEVDEEEAVPAGRQENTLVAGRIHVITAQ